MIFIIELDLPSVTWYAVSDEKMARRSAPYAGRPPQALIDDITCCADVTALCYFLRHGGNVVIDPVSVVTPALADAVQRGIPFMPELAQAAGALMRLLSRRFPAHRHLLFCDTSFFHGLPGPAANYAVPTALRKSGIRRYGGFGIFHQWAHEESFKLAGGGPKTISVFLGETTNAAAVDAGAPAESSIGFTPAEGIPSSTGCGDLDPTVVFEMLARGIALPRIHRLLAQESGLSGLLGKPCTLGELLTGAGKPAYHAVLDVYRYAVLKYIGSFAAVLGGCDRLVFGCLDPEALSPIAAWLCGRLPFAGLRRARRPKVVAPGWRELTTARSATRVYVCGYDRWKIIAEKATMYSKKTS